MWKAAPFSRAFNSQIQLDISSQLGQNVPKRALSTSSSFQAKPVFSSDMPELETFKQMGYKFSNHSELYEFSIREPDIFWGTLAKSRLRWYQEFTQTSDCDMNEGQIAWFMDGKINASGK